MKTQLVIKKIIEETGLSKQEIQEKVSSKKEELKGLISDEGALLVISKELGVDIETLNISTKIDITTSSYLQTFMEIKKELTSENIQHLNYHYIRILSHQDIVREFVDRFNELKETIEKSVVTELDASIIGSKNSVILIKGLGKVYDRSRDVFHLLKDVILRHSESEDKSEDLKIPSRKTSQAAEVIQEPKPEDHKKPDLEEVNREDDFVHEGFVEKFFSRYMDKEEVQTFSGIVGEITGLIDAKNDPDKIKDLKIPEDFIGIEIPEDVMQLTGDEMKTRLQNWLDKNSQLLDIDWKFNEEDPLITKK